MEEHDAETYRDAYRTMATAQLESDQPVAMVCRPGTKPNATLADEVGLSLDQLLYVVSNTTAEMKHANNVLTQSNVIQVFNV